jgi:hypothetical protein
MIPGAVYYALGIVALAGFSLWRVARVWPRQADDQGRLSLSRAQAYLTILGFGLLMAASLAPDHFVVQILVGLLAIGCLVARCFTR